MNRVSPFLLAILLMAAASCSGSTPEPVRELATPATQPVTEDEIVGRWQFVIEVVDLIAAESGQENPLVKSLLSGVGGMVQSIVEAIDVQFEFHADGTVDIAAHSNDLDVTRNANPERETLTWRIEPNGEVVIDDFSNDKINISADGVWLLRGDRLILVENGEERPQINLRRLAALREI
jgi:hypothetical protein